MTETVTETHRTELMRRSTREAHNLDGAEKVWADRTQPDADFTRERAPLGPDDTPDHAQPGPDDV